MKKQAKILTWQLGDRRSHSLIVLSNEPEINVSSTGDMERDVTLTTKKKKKTWKHNMTFYQTRDKCKLDNPTTNQSNKLCFSTNVLIAINCSSCKLNLLQQIQQQDLNISFLWLRHFTVSNIKSTGLTWCALIRRCSRQWIWEWTTPS